jgi:hypothetical protein
LDGALVGAGLLKPQCWSDIESGANNKPVSVIMVILRNRNHASQQIKKPVQIYYHSSQIFEKIK